MSPDTWASRDTGAPAARPDTASSGFPDGRVMMFTTPPRASEPYNADAGPFTISMRSIDSSGKRDRS